MYLISQKKYNCSGCTACEQVCALKAISMQTDEEGFLYPVKTLTKCTDCKLCEKICPFSKPTYFNFSSPLVYAAYNKDLKERYSSSSGGVFYVIAKYIIELHGIVYGAAFDENMKVVHQRVSSKEGLDRLRGSKYVQSFLGNIFNDIKLDLKQGKWTYFVGTPCQVAGLKSFLRKPYPNLVTSDLICHGVPNQLLFDKHLNYLREKYKIKILDYQFRDNRTWGGCETISYKTRSGKILEKKMYSYELSPYLYSFMYSYTCRPSCYHCKFSTVPRQGDITLADFWGVKEFFPQIDASSGVSLILLNSEQGKKIWCSINEQLIFYNSDISSAAKNNHNLLYSTHEPKIRKSIFEQINKSGYKKIAETEFRSPRFWKFKFWSWAKSFAIYKFVKKCYLVVNSKIIKKR